LTIALQGIAKIHQENRIIRLEFNGLGDQVNRSSAGPRLIEQNTKKMQRPRMLWVPTEDVCVDARSLPYITCLMKF
jgi:hypothetical protein